MSKPLPDLSYVAGKGLVGNVSPAMCLWRFHQALSDERLSTLIGLNRK